MDKSLVTVIALSTILVGCGGDDDDHSSDNTDTNAIPANVVSIAKSAVETVRMASAFPATSEFFVQPETQSASMNTVNSAMFGDTSEETATPDSAASISGECGGNAETMMHTTTGEEGPYPINVEWSLQHNNFCQYNREGAQFTIEGNVNVLVDVISETQNSVEERYQFSFTHSRIGAPGQGSLDMKSSCESSMSDTEQLACEYSFYGQNHTAHFNLSKDDSFSETHSKGNLLLDNNQLAGLDFAELAHCENGNIANGSGVITLPEGDTMAIDFDDCMSFTLNYKGSSETLLF
ncbi:hypothetical protein [Marinibactrum halimedae]|uniref:Lipoprotein n=1 Tax=Marinibactrum halimedae TaxID=1444977 RepID=A0AA37T705_9GAMM|nr:hypothetical protein [Marinibactrum halimedae]MCD9459972.1 hypothetical protein [Marinibactrum halimedae]GLS28260.1 hypothetical protein GCM10007877_39790 [Marinibactrum halimedae]